MRLKTRDADHYGFNVPRSRPKIPARSLASIALAAVLFLTVSSAAQDKNQHLSESTPNGTTILWSDPVNIGSRDLFYGPGGKLHEPHTNYTFVKEDLGGSNPKFDVRDENGTKWRVKLGLEARPEIAATRLLWAAGYFTSEDYFLADLRVTNMPRLRRGEKLIDPDGTTHNVRLKRFIKGEKKLGDWQWQNNPFSGTREFNGLRVMMALMNNWDLKNENNSIYEENDKAGSVSHYLVSDLGATFGTTGISFPISKSKGNLPEYSHSRFIRKVGTEYVDFNVPGRPSLLRVVGPRAFVGRMHMRWIGRHIPRADARWIGQILSQLSPGQIRQAFRAAGYSPGEVEGFATVVEKRISELSKL